MRRAVGAAVLIGMICLGSMLSDWMIRVRPDAPDSLIVALPSDSLVIPRTPLAYHTGRERHAPVTPPPSFLSDPLVFLSRAPADSLDLLPGIGPVLAARLVAARATHGGRFESWEQVDAVKGVGPTMIARWKALSTRQ